MHFSSVKHCFVRNLVKAEPLILGLTLLIDMCTIFDYLANSELIILKLHSSELAFEAFITQLCCCVHS